MPFYLQQASYTAEAWAAMMKNSTDPMSRIQSVAEGLGGKVVGFWYAFGEYDVVGIGEYPDNVSIAAASMVFSAGGAVKAMKTTPLMTIEEGLESMKRAGGTNYQAPGG